MKLNTSTILLFILINLIFLQKLSSQINLGYERSFSTLKNMLEEKQSYSFKEAIFLTENAYFNERLSRENFDLSLELLVELTKAVKKNNQLNYEEKDKELIEYHAAIFSVLTDTQTIHTQKDTLFHFPFFYDFDDVFGSQNWQKMFVSKLLQEHSGNCHSLPYLYKIMAEELGIDAHLSIAPNHQYIKVRSEKTGWYNIELTSATFPIDAWLMASGYISLEAVQKGIYLDTLSEKQNIALCVIDMAQGYEHKYPDHDGVFVVQCCDLALEYFPNYVNAILLKAETRLKQLQSMQKEYGYKYLKEVIKLKEGKELWDEMNGLYMQLHQLGYRQMPEQMYVDWLVSINKEKEKYSNKRIQRFD